MSRYSDQILADGAVAYWRLGEASGVVTADAHTNNNDGVYVGLPTLDTGGAIVGDSDTAVTFSGTAQYVTVPDANPLDLGNTFSLECWVKRAATGQMGLIAKGGSYRLEVGPAGASHKIRLRSSSVAPVATILQSTVGFSDLSAYHHIVSTKDGSSSAHIYLDGVDVSATFTDSTLVDTANELVLAANSATTQYLNGTLDEVALYNLVLTPTQVLEHYKLGRSWFGTSALDGASDLVAAAVGAKYAGSPLGAESDFGAAGIRALLASTVLDGSSDLTASASRALYANVDLSGEGVLTAAAIRTLLASSALSGESDLASSAARALFASAGLSADSFLTAEGARNLLASVVLSAESDLMASALRVAFAAAVLSGDGSLTASAWKLAFASAALSGESALSAVSASALFGAAALSGEGSLQASAIRALLGGANLAGEGQLVANALRVALGAAVLSGNSSLIAQALKLSYAAVVLSGEGVLAASGLAVGPPSDLFSRRFLEPDGPPEAFLDHERGFEKPALERAGSSFSRAGIG